MYKNILLLAAVIVLSSCASNQKELKSSHNSGNINMNLSSDSNIILSYINQARAKGAKCAPPAPPVKWNSNLESAASSHTKDMAINNFLQHNGSGSEIDVAKKAPNLGSTYMERIQYFGYSVKPGLLVGEDIARTSNKLAKSNKLVPNLKRAINNWINEPVHCKILMNPRFSYVGADAEQKDGNTYFTVDFAEENRASSN